MAAARRPARSTRSLVVLALLALSVLAPAVLRPDPAGATPAPTTVSNDDALGSPQLRLDVEGRPLDAHDGEIQRFGDRYYLYGTSYGCGFQANVGGPFCGFRSYASTDLVHWVDQGLMFDASTPDWQHRCIPGCYRPHVAFLPSSGRYVAWVNTYEVGVGYHVLESWSPTGPFAEAPSLPRLAANAGYGPGANGDADLFVDGDGTPYLVHTDAFAGYDLVVERLTPDGRTSTGVFQRIGLSKVEAPSMFQRNGRYYITFSDPNCGYCAGTGTSYLTAPTPLGPWGGPQGAPPPLWQYGGGGVRIGGPGVGLLLDSLQWGDYTFSFDAALADDAGGHHEVGWEVRGYKVAQDYRGYRLFLGNRPQLGGSGSVNTLTTVTYRNGGVYSIRSVTLPGSLAVGPWHRIATNVTGNRLTTGVDGVLVDSFVDDAFGSGQVGFASLGGTGSPLVRNVIVRGNDGTLLLNDPMGVRSYRWDDPVAPRTGTSITADSCGGQPTDVARLDTPGGVVYLYQSDRWLSGAFNEAMAGQAWEPLSFAGDGSVQPLTCPASFSAPLELAPPTPDAVPPAVDHAPGRDGYHAVCDIGGGSRRLQAFTVSRSGPFEGVSVDVFQMGHPSGPLTAALYALDLAGAPTGPALSAVVVQPQDAGWQARPVVVDARGLAVAAGQRLGVLLFTAGSGCYGVLVNDTALFADSTSSHDTGSGFVPEPGRALRFTTVVGGTPRAGRVQPLTPSRILDTRLPNASSLGPLGPGSTVDLRVTGVGGVPATGVSAVVLNVTVTDTSAISYLTAWPTGAPRPLASNLNFVGGETVPNLVQVPVGAGGQVSIYNDAGQADVVVDVAGWVSSYVTSSSGLFRPIQPVRVADTRLGSPRGRLGSYDEMILALTGPHQLPAAAGRIPGSGVSAVVLNVTAVFPDASGYLTVYPSGAPRPLASNLNFTAGQVVANRVLARVGPDGQVRIFNPGGSVDVVVDLDGWFTDTTATGSAGAYVPVVPSRLIDSRGDGGTLHASTRVVGAAGHAGVPAASAPVHASAIVMNITATRPAEPGFLTLWPDGQPQPLASDLNFVAGDTVPNLGVVALGPNGAFDLYGSASSVDAVIDVEGWYTSA